MFHEFYRKNKNFQNIRHFRSQKPRPIKITKKSTPQSVGLRNRKNDNIQLIPLFSNSSVTKLLTFRLFGRFFWNLEKLEGVDKVPRHLMGVLGWLCLFSKSAQTFHMVLVKSFFWFCVKNITYTSLKSPFPRNKYKLVTHKIQYIIFYRFPSMPANDNFPIFI